MKKKLKKKVPDLLADLAKINIDRGKVYGDDYKHTGRVLSGYFPRGIHLDTSDDMARFSMWLLMAVKLGRYAQNMTTGGHVDSLDDIAVYSQMIQEWDAECRDRKDEGR